MPVPVPPSPAAYRPVSGHRLLRVASWAGLGVQAAAAAVSVSGLSAELAVPVGMIQIGLCALRALIAVGCAAPARWALWLGGIVYGLNAVAAPLALFGALGLGGQTVQAAPVLGVLLAAAQLTVSVTFLAGLVAHRRTG